MSAGTPKAASDELERISHAFVLRLWREEGGDRRRRPFWRGTITHIPSGRRQSVQRLSEVIAFIVVYLELLGVGIAPTWRLLRWVKRRRAPR